MNQMAIKNKIAILLQQRERIFHTQDIAVLWGITNSNTLHTTIKRYCDKGVLFPIYKGMYTTIPMEQLHPRVLGIKALHRFAYVTCETVLAQHGLVNAVILEITMASAISLRFTIDQQHYRARRLHNRFLFHSFGIIEKQGVLTATPLRAIADMLYFNSRIHFDAPVDWQKVRTAQKTIGYPLTPYRYAHSPT